MAQLTRVAVMYGGKADEHPISCISVASVLRALDTSRFEPVLIGITKQGEWIVDGEDPRQWALDKGLPHDIIAVGSLRQHHRIGRRSRHGPPRLSRSSGNGAQREGKGECGKGCFHADIVLIIAAYPARKIRTTIRTALQTKKRTGFPGPNKNAGCKTTSARGRRCRAGSCRNG